MPETARPPALTDGVVTLRAPGGPADVQGSWEQGNDPESVQWTTVPVPYSHADAIEFIGVLLASWDDDSEWAFVVEYEGEFGGTISLRPERAGRAEVAYGSHPRVRGVDVDGRSVMERALRLLIEWGFSSRGLQTISWWANAGNWASRRLAWKLGFRFEGTVRGYLPQRGEMRDGWVGTLLRDDPREPASAWLEAPTLEDGQVRLRPHTVADVPRMVETARDPETQQWLAYLPEDYDETTANTYLEACVEDRANSKALRLAIADVASDAFLGHVSLINIQPGKSAELAYWTHPEARGRGLTTRAVALVVNHAFGDLGLSRITANVTDGNTGSSRVLERCEFRRTGVVRQAVRTRDGELHGFVTYDRLADEPTGLVAPPLSGSNVTLRPLSEDDTAAVVEMNSDERTQHWLGNTQIPYTAAHAYTWITAFRDDSIDWAIVDPETGAFLGTVGLFNIEPGVEAELTYTGHPQGRSRGVMTEAARLVLAHAFDELGLQLVRGTAAVENSASRYVMDAAGMTCSGIRRLGTTLRTGRVDAACYEISRKEFAADPKPSGLLAPTLRGEKVVLRPWQDDDVPRIYEGCTDEESQRWMGELPDPYTMDESRAWLQRCRHQLATGEALNLAIADPDDDRMLGSMALYHPQRGMGGIMGYWSHPDARGRGVVKEAVRLLLGYAFDELDLRVVRAGAAPDNAASRHILESSGMTYRGTDRLLIRVATGPADAACYDITREEFAASSDAASHSR